MRVRKFRDLLGQEMLILNSQSSGHKDIDLSHHRHMETTSGEVQQRAEETNWSTCLGGRLSQSPEALGRGRLPQSTVVGLYGIGKNCCDKHRFTSTHTILSDLPPTQLYCSWQQNGVPT